MVTRSTRRLAVTAIVVGAAAAALAAPLSPAAVPKKGTFTWGTRNGNDSVAFYVRSTPRKIKGLVISALACKHAAPIRVETVKVRSSGRFNFSGSGHIFDGTTSKVVFRGKFVRPKKAKGTATVEACDVTLDFTARYHEDG